VGSGAKSSTDLPALIAHILKTLLTTLTAVLAHPDWASGYGGCGEEDVDDDQEDQDQVRAGDRDPVLYGGACGVRGSRGGRDSESGHLDFRI